MCGILCSLSKTRHHLPGDDISHRLQARGPDSTGTVSTAYTSISAHRDAPAHETWLTFHSTVLSLRGQRTITQPYQGNDKAFTLCWNGEAWSIDGECPSGNDTEAVYQLLTNSLSSSSTPENSETCVESASRISRAVSRIAGPYAFAFFDHSRGRIFFGRDFLGRRSLLWRTSERGDLIICSVSDGNAADGWTEVECDGIYHIDLNMVDTINRSLDSSAVQYQIWGVFVVGTAPYNFANKTKVDPNSSLSVIPFLSLARRLPSCREPLHAQSIAVAELEIRLRDSLSLRVRNIPIPPVSHNGIYETSGRAKLAILFSGGIDCTILARLSHELLPESEPIDLLNVAFENPRMHNTKSADSSVTVYELCPDRITGRTSYAELHRVCPGRDWRFVAIDVPFADTLNHRGAVISLMHPHNTEMDLSIATALYFAARGEGWISNSLYNEPVPYTTPARVLLSGLGADELFAGYTRHATAFKRGGFSGLLDELELDVARLGKRNLGRDDRVMSHWGKEVRFPYLDEDLLSWALNAPVTEKCGFGKATTQERTSTTDDDSFKLEPDKKILRCLVWKLGMRGVAREKKRAIQFGARTAKMETGKTKGTQMVT